MIVAVSIINADGQIAITTFNYQPSVVVPPGDNDYFDMMAARSDVFVVGGLRRVFALRSQAEIDTYSQAKPNTFVTYDAMEDMAVAVIPVWSSKTYTLATPLLPGETTLTIADTNVNNGIHNQTCICIGDEAELVYVPYAAPVVGAGTLTYIVQRGLAALTTMQKTLIPVLTASDAAQRLSWLQARTVERTHLAATTCRININSLPNIVRVPIGTDKVADADYLIVNDLLWWPEWLGTMGIGGKDIQIADTKNSIWFEETFQAQTRAGVTPPGIDRSKHIGFVSVRSYNHAGGGSDWSATDGTLACTEDGCTPRLFNNPAQLAPLDVPYFTATGRQRGIIVPFMIGAARRMRVWRLVEVRANDYTRMSLIVGDVEQGIVRVLDRVQVSLRNSATFGRSIFGLWLELNSSDNQLRHHVPMRVGINNIVTLRGAPGAAIGADWSALLITEGL